MLERTPFSDIFYGTKNIIIDIAINILLNILYLLAKCALLLVPIMYR